VHYRAHGIAADVPEGWSVEEKSLDRAWRITFRGPSKELVMVQVFEGTMPLAMALEMGKKLVQTILPGVPLAPLAEPFMGGEARGFRLRKSGTRDTLYGKLLVLIGESRTVMCYAQFLESARQRSYPALSGIISSLRWAES